MDQAGELPVAAEEIAGGAVAGVLVELRQLRAAGGVYADQRVVLNAHAGRGVRLVDRNPRRLLGGRHACALPLGLDPEILAQ